MKVRFTCTGISPLLFHRDDVEWSDEMKAWSINPANAQKSVAGDDRTPVFRWLGSCYHDAEYLTIPADVFASALTQAGKQLKTGKGGKTFKDAAAAGMIIEDEQMPLLVNGKKIPWKPITAFAADGYKGDFTTVKKAVEAMGFALDVRRARVNQTKHVRVRPKFDKWSVTGVVDVWREDITLDILRQMFEIAGARVGICDWRPGSPKVPGPFGRFTAELKKEAD